MEEVMAESGMHVINTKEKMWLLIATRSRAMATEQSGWVWVGETKGILAFW